MVTSPSGSGFSPFGTFFSNLANTVGKGFDAMQAQRKQEGELQAKAVAEAQAKAKDAIQPLVDVHTKVSAAFQGLAASVSRLATSATEAAKQLQSDATTQAQTAATSLQKTAARARKIVTQA
ncbi:MAG TPA: hypothetical protein VN457_00360, partial [Chlamydiales bacterium]|nr:hypothetical protein [Chlamydiales bacterium]